VLVDESGHAWLLEFTKGYNPDNPDNPNAHVIFIFMVTLGPALRLSPEHMRTLHGDMLTELTDVMCEVHDSRIAGVPWHDQGESLLGSTKNFKQIWPPRT